MATISSAGHRLGSALVAAQFILMGALGWCGGPALLAGRWPEIALTLLGLGVGVGGLALFANRPGNFNIHPAPRPAARLITTGIYRQIRHPMYTAILLAGFACSWAAGSVLSRLFWLALLAVLARKAALEEDWLRTGHPDYEAYSARSARFLPWLY